MNFLQASISEDGKKVEFAGGDALDLPNELSKFANQRVSVGLRPEHLIVTNGDAEQASQKVHVVEHLGADTLVHGTFGNGGSELTVRLQGIRTIAQGEVLPLSIDPDNIHVFNTDTGKRLEQVS